MNTALKTLALATIVAGAIALAGCTSTAPAPTPSDSTAPTSTSTPAPAETAPGAGGTTVEGIAGLPAGATLDAAQIKKINQSTGTGMRAYRFADGSAVLVKLHEPLPEAVMIAEQQKLSAIPMPAGGSNGDQDKSNELIDAAQKAAQYATGKPSCVLIHGEFGNLDGPGTSPKWIALGCPVDARGIAPVGADKAAVIAEAQARIAAQPNAADYALIVEP